MGDSQFSGIDMRLLFDGAEGHLDRAFRAFLYQREVFEQASCFHFADSLGDWHTRTRLPVRLPDQDEESRTRLSRAVSEYYKRKEGRGHRCDVAYYKRDERHYWFVYPEDYAVSTLVFDERHQLNKQTQRPAFEVIFAYLESERSLETRAAGGSAVIQDLDTIWGRTILSCELGPEPEKGVVYHLDELRSRDFEFAVEPEDGVSEVRVKRLRIKVMGSDQRITLETPARRDPKEIYDLLERVRKGLRVPEDLIAVASVGLQLVFAARAGHREEKLSFNVSHPNSCSLRG